MYIETTVNINDELLEMLDNAAESLGLSRSRLISVLLVKYVKQNRGGKWAFSRLRYQERRDGCFYSKKTIFLRKDVYDVWCDVRKLFKLSASYIIALAIKKYLGQILKNQKVPHNYFPMYVAIASQIGNLNSYSIIWGDIDTKILKKLLYQP